MMKSVFIPKKKYFQEPDVDVITKKNKYITVSFENCSFLATEKFFRVIFLIHVPTFNVQYINNTFSMFSAG